MYLSSSCSVNSSDISRLSPASSLFFIGFPNHGSCVPSKSSLQGETQDLRVEVPSLTFSLHFFLFRSDLPSLRAIPPNVQEKSGCNPNFIYRRFSSQERVESHAVVTCPSQLFLSGYLFSIGWGVRYLLCFLVPAVKRPDIIFSSFPRLSQR